MSRLLSLLVPALLLAGLAAPPSLAEESEGDARKRALVVRVMELTGATAHGDQVSRVLLDQLKPAYPQVPEEVWKELEGSFALEEIIELSIPIYMENFDEQELEQLVEMYESPIGRKMVERMPSVMQESADAFGRWHQQKVGEVIEKLRAKGYEPQAMPSMP